MENYIFQRTKKMKLNILYIYHQLDFEWMLRLLKRE